MFYTKRIGVKLSLEYLEKNAQFNTKWWESYCSWKNLCVQNFMCGSSSNGPFSTGECEIKIFLLPRLLQPNIYIGITKLYIHSRSQYAWLFPSCMNFRQLSLGQLILCAHKIHTYNISELCMSRIPQVDMKIWENGTHT